MTDLFVSISDLKQFKTCRQRWDFSSPLRRSLRPRAVNRHLLLGSGVHEALQAYYTAMGTPNVVAETDKLKAQAAAVEAFATWAKDAQEKLPYSYMTPDDIQEVTEALQLGHGMIAHYAQWAAANDDFSEILATEVTIKFGIPFFGRPVYFVGRADGWVKSKGMYWLLEHKTCTSFPNPQALFMDEQCIAYLWTTQIDPRFEGRRPTGTIFTFLGKDLPQVPSLLKSGGLSKAMGIKTTAQIYEAELQRHGLPTTFYADILERLKHQPNPFFQRFRIQRTEKSMKRFGAMLMATIKEMLDPMVTVYPNCTWWTFPRCPYRVPCSMVVNGIDPTPILKEDYLVQEERYGAVDLEPVMLEELE